MPEVSGNRPYTLLAQYYDRFFRDHLPGFRRARRKLFGAILPRVRTACDLACGTGTTAVELSRRGIKVYAVDLSPTMCRLARAKARRAGIRVVVIRCDMRTFRLPEPVDLITCEYDALNHVPRKADLARVLRQAARNLRPGGHFYFDVNNRLHLEKNWPGTMWFEDRGVVTVARGSYDRRRAKGCLDLEWFIRKKGRWRRYREHIEEVSWTPSEIRRALRGAGFAQIRSKDAVFFFRGRGQRAGRRTFYLAQKPFAKT